MHKISSIFSNNAIKYHKSLLIVNYQPDPQVVYENIT